LPRRELTILIPAYNEAQRIVSTLESALEWARARLDAHEVLVVDDGSTDGTGELVRKHFGDEVRLVRREQRGGKGAAIRTGVENASKPWILFSDADHSIPFTEFEGLWAEAGAAPIVIGSKRAPGGHLEYPPLRRFLGGIGQMLISLFVVSGFHDTQCGFKLYRTDVARELFRQQRIGGFGFDFELLMLAKRQGHAVREVAIHCEHKIGGSVRLRTYLTVLAEIGRIRWNLLCGRYPRPVG
jgi:dolichyl-phosphate beta-glucosyltransferase